MKSSVAEQLAGLHPQMLSVGLRPAAKADPQKLADLRPEVGRLVARAFEIAGLSKQEASFQMGYSDQGTVSRWCSGVERAQFDKLFQVRGFRQAWLLALAEDTPHAEVTTVVSIRRRA